MMGIEEEMGMKERWGEGERRYEGWELWSNKTLMCM
jgi:hypothetical protein